MPLKKNRIGRHNMLVRKRMINSASYRLPMPVTHMIRYANSVRYSLCPRCGQVVEREYTEYCSNCGQHLSWNVHIVVVKHMND